MRTARRNITLGLFKAGLVLAEKGLVLLSNADAYNQSMNGDTLEFANNTDLQWITNNVPKASGDPACGS